MAHMQIPKLEDGTLATLAVILANPNVQVVVIDRQAGHSPFVMAFSVPWNTLRDMAEKRESLTKVLVIDGRVERGEPCIDRLIFSRRSETEWTTS